MFLEDDLVETVIRTADENGMVNLPIESYDLTYHKIGTTISDGNIEFQNCKGLLYVRPVVACCDYYRIYNFLKIL